MKAALDALRLTIQTSETKLTLIIILWALAHRLFPSVPIEIAPIDLSAAGLGTITPSLGTLGVYVIGRCIVKAVTPGQIPFVPENTQTVTTIQPSDVATRTVIDTPAKDDK